MCFSFSLPMLKMEKKRMAETVDGKKEDADYKRVQSFPLIRHTDMPEEMRVETMELCVTACEKFASNNESAAKMIKESMDKKFGSSWHVVIGEGFGFEVVVGVCLLCEAVQDRMCVAALH
ncbi:dynein axonemal light chain 4 isoform X2 [Carassius carassius]|uniref:dynein axonemal light chain 4 isoform X2 n=1 Tax=Carassius carassius TaxID=217509 RepID=UPI0028692758|nr:dynein axonemal light chain 4 isoform X2 [Carassius carassius]